MLQKLLLPNKFKMAGWFILVPAAIAGIVISITGIEAGWLQAKVFALFNQEMLGIMQSFRVIEVNVTNTIVGILFVTGAMLVGFSKEKQEDEYIANLRLSSLLWAVIVNYILLLIALIFIYGTAFLSVMIYNMFTVLIIFITRFNYILYKNFKTVDCEK